MKRTHTILALLFVAGCASPWHTVRHGQGERAVVEKRAAECNAMKGCRLTIEYCAITEYGEVCRFKEERK